MKFFLSVILLVAILIISGCLSEDKNTVFTPPTTTLNLIPTSETKPNAENKFDITSPGHYSLDSDITHSTPYGIKIRASSVTINGNGHTISPSSKMIPSFGISISEKDINGNLISNVQIRNIVIKNEDTGIFLTELKNSTFSNVSVRGNDKAIQATRTDHITIQNSEITNNREGISIDNSQFNTISKNTVRDNQISGIHLYSGSKNNVVKENTVSNNNYGISMGDVYFTTVSRNVVSNNRKTGIHVESGSSDNTFSDNKLENNQIVVEPDCTNNIINGQDFKNLDNDTDGDGVSNAKEIEMHSDPLKVNTYAGLDDFNRLFTYADYNLDSQEKVNEFLRMIPNIKARDARASEGFSKNVPVTVHDTMKENLKHALDDPIIGYYAGKTILKFDSDGKHGKIIVDGEEVYKIGDMTLNGVNPAYYWTHGRPGACASSSFATLAILKKMGLEAHEMSGTSLKGEYIMLDRVGHAWVEFKYRGNEYVSNYGDIRPKTEWYSKSEWTNASGAAPDLVI